MTEHTSSPVYAVEIHNLNAGYAGRQALWDINLTIPKGILCGIIGPNGSGKSTLLKSIMGLHKPDSGSIKVLGDNIDNIRHKVSFVPQREKIDWDYPVSVFDVALMGRYSPGNIFRRTSRIDIEIALEALKKVNLFEYKDKHISQLSGGQQQRVFLARALAQQAELFIMDEPFAAVDAVTEDAILSLMQDMKKEGKTVIIVHHDIQTAKEFFDYIVMLNTRLVVAAPGSQAFTARNLKDTFGSKLSIISKLGELMADQELGTTLSYPNKSPSDDRT